MNSLAPLMAFIIGDTPVTDDAFADVTKGDKLIRSVERGLGPTPIHTIECKSGGYSVQHYPDGIIRAVHAYIRRPPVRGYRAFAGELIAGLDATMTREEVHATLGTPGRIVREPRALVWKFPTVIDRYDRPFRLILDYAAEDGAMLLLTMMPAPEKIREPHLRVP